MRRTNIEFTRHCEKILAERHDTVSGMCKVIGIPQAIFSMWKRAGDKEMNQKIGVIIDIAFYLGLSLDEFFGLREEIKRQEEKQKLPADIADMVRMLGFIQEADRKMIRLNIKNYYDVALEKKAVIRNVEG